MARLAWNAYGKARVRLMRVVRAAERHELQEVTVRVRLEGDFEAVHTRGDNARCLPTDTMKNTVLALARAEPIGELEDFGLRLARHFAAVEAVSRARIELVERRWSRITVGGVLHPHAFTPAEGGDRRTAEVEVAGGAPPAASVESGLDDLLVLKTTGSAFAGFPRDAYTTLRETQDRVLATRIRATWRCSGARVPWGEVWSRTRAALVESFALHDASRSVQHTLHAMGTEALARCPQIAAITLALPNQHCLLADLAPFGLDNPNLVFIPTDEPHGLIEARLER